MCAVCSECSLNLVAGQVFVGACSVGFFSDLYYQGANVAGYIVFALVLLQYADDPVCIPSSSSEFVFSKNLCALSLSLIVLAISLVNQGVGCFDFLDLTVLIKWDEGVKIVTENTIKEAPLVINVIKYGHDMPRSSM